MPLARDGKRADAQSRDTTYSGLPKAIRLVNWDAQGPGTAGAWAGITYGGKAFGDPTGYAYNYGGFTYTVAGGSARPSRVIIPEPGIYLCQSSIQTGQVNEIFLSWQWDKKGVAGGIPSPETGSGSCAPTVNAARTCTDTILDMSEGDKISPVFFVVTNAPTFPADGSCWYSVTKIGGQY